MLSMSPHDNHILPKNIKNVEVCLKSACAWTFHQDHGTNFATDPCFKMEFHAAILEDGDFKGLRVLVTKLFQPPVINPYKGVQLDIGTIVKVSGRLTAQRPNNDQAGLTAFFHIDANAITREDPYKQARELIDKQRVSRSPLYTPNTLKLANSNAK